MMPYFYRIHAAGLMRFRLFSALFFLLVPLYLADSCWGQVSLDRVIIDFKAGAPPVTNLTVRNSSDSVLYVRTQPYVVERAGESDEKLVETDRLLISPKRFSIAAKGERVVRLLLRDSSAEIEKVYRASFMPVADEAGLEGLVDPNQKRTAVLRVLTGMGILVFLQPVTLAPQLTWERIGNKVRIVNSGNINMFFDQAKVCGAENQPCRELSPRRLYPGNVLEVDATPVESVIFRKFANDEFSNEVIPKQDSEALLTPTPIESPGLLPAASGTPTALPSPIPLGQAETLPTEIPTASWDMLGPPPQGVPN